MTTQSQIKVQQAITGLDKTPTRDILKFRQATWDTPWRGLIHESKVPCRLVKLAQSRFRSCCQMISRDLTKQLQS